jgi:hypothetical protein
MRRWQHGPRAPWSTRPRAGLSLSAIFGVTAIAAAALAVLSFVVARSQRALAGSRPRLTPAK